MRKSIIVFLFFISSNLYAQHVIDQVMAIPPGFPDHIMKPRAPQGKYLGPGLFAHTQPLFEIYSGATKKFAGTKEGELYIRNESFDEIEIIHEAKDGWYWSTDGAMFSPDGNYLAVKQIDDREVPKIKLTHKSTEEVTYKAYSRAGEELPKHQFYIVEIETKKVSIIDHGLKDPYVHILGWDNKSKSVRLLMSDRFFKKIELFEVAVFNGVVTKMLTAQSDTYLIGLNLLQGYTNRLREMNLVWFLDEKKQFIWTSDRSGFDQLYLYDLKGNLIKPITDKKKNGIVSKLIEVDSKNGWAYFYAFADEKHPYATQLFRTSLFNNKIEKLVDGPAFLDVLFSKAKDSLWVFRTKLPGMMQIDVFSAAGKFINTAWKANLEPVKKAGLEPEYIQALAADNKTKLEALILKPKNFDPTLKYPVVEYIYGAPHTNIIPRDIFDRSMWNLQNLANNGFIVIMIDSRGTPSRGKAFLDYSYGKFGQVEIDDHVAVIKQIGKQKSYMDLTKVGITGHSWGGYFALKALIDAPYFYKAGHLNAAAIDPEYFRIAIEPFMGCFPKDCPEKYKAAAITNKLDQLKAPIMISHGTADDDVPVEEAYKLIEALKSIGYKNYEYIEYQGMDHIIMRNPKWESTLISFFEKHLKN